MRPIGTKLIIKRHNDEEKTDSGIILVRKENKKVNPTATVVAVSDRIKNDPQTAHITVGCDIMFERGHDINTTESDIKFLDIKSVITKL